MTLSVSQRIRLIRDVAERLAEEDYSLIDLTLSQFGLRWTNEWRGTKQAYTLEMIEDAPETVLLDLAEHVGAATDEAPPRIDPTFWRPRLFRVFISHLSDHRVYAAELQKFLLKYGITSFVAHNDIEPTSERQVQIETALATAESLIALLHPNFHASKWTDQEIGFAMGRGLPVFAIRLGEDPYGFIGRFQAFTGHGKVPADLASELLESYRTNKDTQSAMASALVRLFEQSDSFAEAKRNIAYLEALNVWEPSFTIRVQAATAMNGQIQGSWNVPERVTALLQKWGVPKEADLDDEIPF